MAAPQVLGIAFTDDTDGSGLTVPINLPAGIQAGELIVIAISINSTNSVPISFPVGWVIEYQTTQETFISGAVVTHVADGAEGSSVLMTKSSANSNCAIAYRIEQSGNVEVNNQGNPNSNNNPVPSISPSGGTNDYLYLVFDAIDTYLSPVSTFPVGYINTNTLLSGIGGARCALGYGEKETTNSTTESPTDFIISGTARRTVTSIVAIAPTGSPSSFQPAWAIYANNLVGGT